MTYEIIKPSYSWHIVTWTKLLVTHRYVYETNQVTYDASFTYRRTDVVFRLIVKYLIYKRGVKAWSITAWFSIGFSYIISLPLPYFNWFLPLLFHFRTPPKHVRSPFCDNLYPLAIYICIHLYVYIILFWTTFW